MLSLFSQATSASACKEPKSKSREPLQRNRPSCSTLFTAPFRNRNPGWKCRASCVQVLRRLPRVLRGCCSLLSGQGCFLLSGQGQITNWDCQVLCQGPLQIGWHERYCAQCLILRSDGSVLLRSAANSAACGGRPRTAADRQLPVGTMGDAGASSTTGLAASRWSKMVANNHNESGITCSILKKADLNPAPIFMDYLWAICLRSFEII